MVEIEDFWRVDDLIRHKWGKNAHKHVDYCGLDPIRPMEHFGYFCTPKNSKTFAATGGDGVHFGFVDGLNNRGTPGPIVMTVPMSDVNNVIIAEDFQEFLSLGYHVGWFALEQIVYDLDYAIDYHSNADEDMSSEELQFLEMLKTDLPIKHIPLTRERLDQLKQDYFGRLDIGTAEGQEK